MKKQTKIVMNFSVFILLIILTLYVLLKDQNILDVFDIIKSAKLEFVLLGILCVSVYVICEAVNIPVIAIGGITHDKICINRIFL